MAHTMIFLLGALAPTRTIRPSQDLLLQKTLLPLSHPPVAQAIQHDLSCAQPAYSVSRCVRVGIHAAGYRMNVDEKLQIDEGVELARLAL